MKLDEPNKSSRSNQSRKGGSSAVRPKVGRGIGRKRLKLSQTRPSNGKTDEDSGLGGETSTSDSNCEGSTKSNELTMSSYFLAVDRESNHLVLSNFGCKSNKSHSSSRCSNVEMEPKRLRLDMTEEANELPEQNSDTAQQIVSFKNVPDLRAISSTNNLSNSVKIFSTNILHSFLQPSKIPKPQQVVQPVVQPSVKKIDEAKKPLRGDSGLSPRSSDGQIFLELLSQPESQHRARYQTEGSRGAVKDRSGQGHPIVKLNGYCKSTVLKVFVASDGDSVSPHMFYQACKVTGKNSTPCTEIKEDGTIILHIDMAPDNEMTVSCDCVGILKERNVDVEKRVKSTIFGGRKKSHKCRLVFRTSVTLKSGKIEELQVVSQSISCSQPPGLPEICRKSLSKSSVEGGEELFIIGKNFSKDTEVVFQKFLKKQEIWEQKMIPDKEFLNGTHLICKVPPYQDSSIMECVDVQVFIVSNGKKSDPHTFTYKPSELKNENHDSGQLQPLPSKISPCSLKLNMLYAESEGLKQPKVTPSFSSKDPEQIKVLKGQLIKEKEVVHPLSFIGTISGSNSPSVASKTYAKMDGTNSNMFSTSLLSPSSPNANTGLFVPITVSTVASASPSLPDGKPIILAPYHLSVKTQQQQKVANELKTVTGDNKIKDLKIAERSDHSVVENLCHMLKFVYALPVKLQSSLLELLSNELLTQIRGKGLSSDKPVVDSAIPNSVTVDPMKPVEGRIANENAKKSLKSERNIISADNSNLCFANPISNSPTQSYVLPMAIIPPQNSNKHVNQIPLNTLCAIIASKQSATNHALENKQFSHSLRQQSQCDTRHFNALSGAETVQNLNPASVEILSNNHHLDFLSMSRKSIVPSESQHSEFTIAVHNAQKPLRNASKNPQFIESNFPSSDLCEDIKAASSIESLFTTAPSFDFRPQQTIAPLTPFIFTPTASTNSSRTLITPTDSSPNAQLFAQNHIKTDTSAGTSFMHNSILQSHLLTGKEAHSNMVLHEREKISLQNLCFSNSTISDPLQSNNAVTESTIATYPQSLERTMSVNLGSIPTTYDLSSVMHSENCDPLLSQASKAPSLLITPPLTISGNSNNFNVINSAASSDVSTTLPQLSESELLSYINPNCFDNV